MSSERKEVEDRLLAAEAKMATHTQHLDEKRKELANPNLGDGVRMIAIEDMNQARAAIGELQPELAALQLAKKRLDDTAAEKREARELARRERDAAVEAALAKVREEDRGFWFRRFHTSLAIAHGAAFAAIGSKLFDSTVDKATAGGAWYPMVAFGMGMLFAGLIPVALYRDSQKMAWRLAIISASLLIIGLFAALWAVWNKAELVWPWQL